MDKRDLQVLKNTKNYKSFLITSSIGGEGKTITALNVAIALAKELNNKSVLLIDADMRKGKISGYMGMNSHPGLAELLQDKVEEDNVFINPGIENLNIILLGKQPKNSSEY